MTLTLIEGLPKVDSGIVGLVLALITGIFWLARLESKTGTNTRDIENGNKRQDHHEIKLADLDNKVMDKLGSIEKIVANIQGQLSK